ncbi:hypothetical protein RUND412_002148 [Rhizina undulata]
MDHNDIKNSVVESNNNSLYRSGNTILDSNNFNLISIGYIQNVHVHTYLNNTDTVNGNANAYAEEAWHIQGPPFQRNPKFCGRQDILDQLCQILDPQALDEHALNTIGSISGRKMAVLYGLGGTEKSQIAALIILEQLVAHYASKGNLVPDYPAIANILGIPGQIDPSGRIAQISTALAITVIHNWLVKFENRRWLLLIDNSDESEVGNIDKLLPICNWGSVIITSRMRNLIRLGPCIEVEGIGTKEGLNLLLASAGVKKQDLDRSELDEAKKILNALGELPLALDHAGAYISSLQIRFSTYRKIAFGQTLPKTTLSSWRTSVFGTWELSFQALSVDARRLLQLCAFLSNEKIPEELFRRGMRAVYWLINDKNKLYDAILELLKFSLAKRTENDCIWIHPLAHTWARERNNITLQERDVEDIMRLIEFAIRDSDDSDKWLFERSILSHKKVCQGHIAKYFSGSDGDKAASVLSAMGSAYSDLGYYEQSEQLYRRAMEGWEKALGKDHPATLDAVNNLGIVHSSGSGALAGREKALEKDHSSTLDAVNNIGIVFRKQGRYDKAFMWFQRALAGREKVLEEGHPDTLNTLKTIAKVNRQLSDVSSANQIIEGRMKLVKRGISEEDYNDKGAFKRRILKAGQGHNSKFAPALSAMGRLTIQRLGKTSILAKHCHPCLRH